MPSLISETEIVDGFESPRASGRVTPSEARTPEVRAPTRTETVRTRPVSPEEGAACKRGVELGYLLPMGIALALALAAFVTAHFALVAGIGARGPWWCAVLSLVVAPLAPWWGWGLGMRRRTLAWAAALALYAFGVSVA